VLKRYYANGGTELTSGRRYLYDGWNLVAEYEDTGVTAPGSLKRTYTWGLDIARSLSDAGGVGALLQIADHPTGKTYLPAYDGNGNVAALFDAADGTVAAAYEYSPYGEFFRCEGTYARENSFRFSTKFTDDETGLVYYGRRYYSPSQGRFLGRDPKMEKGGLNLYGFCLNNPINLWDYLGMEAPWWIPRAGEEAETTEERDGVVYRQWWRGELTGREGDDETEWVLVSEAPETSALYPGGSFPGNGSGNATRGMPEVVDFVPPIIGIGIIVAGSTPVGMPQQYKKQTFVSRLDAIYRSGILQRTYVNPAMLPGGSANSGSGVVFQQHLEARELSPQPVTGTRDILDDLGRVGRVDVITIAAHGAPGYLNLDGGRAGQLTRALGNANIAEDKDFWVSVRKSLNPGAVVVLLACEFGQDDQGVRAMKHIALLTGATVVAPTGFYAINGPDYSVVPGPHTPPSTPMGFIVVPPFP
jgi:RHS repeat-associated protein